MRQFQQSSGDLVADRRAAWAAALARDKDFAAAAELMAQALELAPGWAAGWCLHGDYLKEAGERAGAIAAYRQLAALDGAGVFGAALKLAALGAGEAPGETAITYVESLFDDYAERFEAELIGGLGYAAPERLAAVIRERAAATGLSARRTLDLGCGTGLMARALEGFGGEWTGVDLSAEMLARAEETGLYARLDKAELTAFLRAGSEPYDLIVAADVLNYVGALDPVFAAARPRLAPGGLFAMTLEQHGGPERMVLRDSLRYAHAADAVQQAALAAGFVVADLVAAPLRMDRGVPVAGLYVVLASG